MACTKTVLGGASISFAGMVLIESPPVGIQPCPISLFTMASSCGMLVAAKRTYFTSNANLVPTFPNVKVVAFVRNQVAGICNRTAFFWEKRRVTIRFRRVKGGPEKKGGPKLYPARTDKRNKHYA